MRIRIFSLFMILYFTSCKSVNYEQIPGVDKNINAIGKAIAKYQRSEVWTGGNEYTGCYTSEHRRKFIQKRAIQIMVEKAKMDPTFKKGVIALKKKSLKKQDTILELWNKPIDPTWSETGRIGKGTTDAGQQTEIEIAEALTELVKDMLRLTDEEINNL